MSSVHRYCIFVRVNRERKGAEYTVSLQDKAGLAVPKEGLPINRYFTDVTLPEDLKWRLGILNANPRVEGVGQRYLGQKNHEEDALYFIEGTKELHSLLLDGAT